MESWYDTIYRESKIEYFGDLETLKEQRVSQSDIRDSALFILDMAD